MPTIPSFGELDQKLQDMLGQSAADLGIEEPATWPPTAKEYKSWRNDAADKIKNAVRQMIGD